tara:strand:+ start:1822 stop:3342 length:1521 start_codon:yes stop_codon:yes gene_type:complete
MSNKIFQLEDLAAQLKQLRASGKKIVHCHGVFDLLHLGHIRYLKEAKSFGDVLVVTITPDMYVRRGPARPAFSGELRAEAIAAIGVVDFVAINKWPTAIDTIKILKPDFYIKGPDYKDYTKDVTGNIQSEEDAVSSVGGEIRFTSDIAFSSTKLVNRYLNLYSDNQKKYVDSLKLKHSMDEIYYHFNKLKELKVLTVGETILDEYVFCEAIGKSGKEPILVTQEISKEVYLGGILAIANHLSDFCDNINVVSFLGENGDGEDFVKESMGAGVKTNFLYKKNSPTIIKRRYIDNIRKSKLFGVYDINDELIDGKDEQLFYEELDNQLPAYDLVIVADYGHGIITERIIELLAKKSRFLALNSQVNAGNIGYHTISKYPRANCIVINETELRHEFRNRLGDIDMLIKCLADNMETDAIIVTRGKNGAILYGNSGNSITCPAFDSKVVDIIGAGDALLTLSSACMSIGMPEDLSLFIGSLSAAQSVETFGNSKPVNKVDLLKAIDSILK